jgi:hypothetical protein
MSSAVGVTPGVGRCAFVHGVALHFAQFSAVRDTVRDTLDSGILSALPLHYLFDAIPVSGNA